MKTLIIDNKPTRNYTDDFILENSELVKDWHFVPLYNKNFVKPFWNGTEFVESTTAEELQVIENQKKFQAKEEVATLYVQLYKSALSRVTSKSGTLDYLIIQKKEYEDKYKCALEVINDQPITNQFVYAQIELEKEFEDFVGEILYIKIAGINQMITNPEQPIEYPILNPTNNRMKDFCLIIKFFYETNNFIFENFMKMIVFIRTRMNTDIEFGKWENYNNRLVIVKEVLSGNLTNKELQDKFILFKNIDNDN